MDGLELVLPEESPPDPDSQLCPYSRAFKAWCEEQIAPVEKSPSIVAVAYKKVLLQDKYHDYRNAVPRTHRDYSGKGHECLYHVYCASYNRIRLVELGLPSSVPFTLHDGTATRPRPPQQVAGIIIGEQD